MSGGKTVGLVDFVKLSFEIDRVRADLSRSFLVRNWCGPWLAVEAVGAQDTAERASAIGQEAEVICFSPSQAPLRIQTRKNRGKARMAPAPADSLHIFRIERCLGFYGFGVSKRWL